jgi:hypothetical protein
MCAAAGFGVHYLLPGGASITPANQAEFSPEMSDAVFSPQDTERLRDQVFSARLEALGARLDGRLASLEATITALSRRMEERFALVDARFAQVDARMSNIEATVAAMQKAIGGLKTTMIVTAVGAVIGVATFNATVLSNMLASFESGRNLSETQAKILRQSEETEAILKRIEQGLIPRPGG